HRHEMLREDVVEATLRQAAIERHLAALEAVDGDAGAGLLALDAAAAGLAGARADATAETLLGMGRAFVVTQIVEFHGLSPARLSGLVDDADEVRNGGDHAAHRRRVLQRAPL